MTESVETSALTAHCTGTTGQTGTVVRSTVLRRLFKNPLGIMAMAILLALVAPGRPGPMSWPRSTRTSPTSPRPSPPRTPVNILGTDSAGRDVWSRLLFGAQLTLLSALLCAAVAIGIGLPAGLIAGYYAGKFEAVSNWVVSILMSLPGPDRAADHPRGLRPVGVDRHDRVRRPDQPVLLPPDPHGRAVGPQRALRGCRPGVRALATCASSPATSSPWSGPPSSSRPRRSPVWPSPSSPAWSSWAWAIPPEATWGVMLSEGFKNVYLDTRRCSSGPRLPWR